MTSWLAIDTMSVMMNEGRSVRRVFVIIRSTPPALLTRISIVPWRETIFIVTLDTTSGLVRSAGNASTPPTSNLLGIGGLVVHRIRYQQSV